MEVKTDEQTLEHRQEAMNRYPLKMKKMVQEILLERRIAASKRKQLSQLIIALEDK